MKFFIWPITSGVLTSLLLPHLPSSLTDSLPSLNLWCHSKTDARSMQDAPKAVWSIPYISVALFPSLKHNVIAYHSSRVSWRPDCIFEILQLWQSGFSRVYCCCSCSFEAEIIKISQSSHKMYSNSILNFQVFTTILNNCTKSLETYWRHHVNILSLSHKRVQNSVCVRERHRQGDEGRGRRLAEDCYIEPFLNDVVIPYSGPYLFASLTRSSKPESHAHLYAHRSPNLSTVWLSWLCVSWLPVYT